MVLQENQAKLRALLTKAVPMLCKGGLDSTEPCSFSVEAFIGITLHESYSVSPGAPGSTIVISFKETMFADGDTVSHVWSSDHGEDNSKSDVCARQAKKQMGASDGEEILSGNFVDEDGNGSATSRAQNNANRSGVDVSLKCKRAARPAGVSELDGDHSLHDQGCIDLSDPDSKSASQIPASPATASSLKNPSSCRYRNKIRGSAVTTPSRCHGDVKSEFLRVKSEYEKERYDVADNEEFDSARNSCIKLEDDDAEGPYFVHQQGEEFHEAYDTAEGCWNDAKDLTEVGDNYDQFKEELNDPSAYDGSYAVPSRKRVKRSSWHGAGLGHHGFGTKRNTSFARGYSPAGVVQSAAKRHVDAAAVGYVDDGGREAQPCTDEYRTMMEDMCSNIMQQSTVDHRPASDSYVCHICNARLGSSGTLKAHIKGSHLQLMSYKCDICSESFKWFMQLHRHRKRFHPDDFPPSTGGPVAESGEGLDYYS